MQCAHAGAAVRTDLQRIYAAVPCAEPHLQLAIAQVLGCVKEQLMWCTSVRTRIGRCVTRIHPTGMRPGHASRTATDANRACFLCCERLVAGCQSCCCKIVLSPASVYLSEAVENELSFRRCPARDGAGSSAQPDCGH